MEQLLTTARRRPGRPRKVTVEEAASRLSRRQVWEKKIEKVGISNVMEAVELLMEKAKEGDFAALKLFLELFLPPSLKEKAAFFDKPIVLEKAKDFDDISDRILSLASSGRVALKDAEKMMNMVEVRRRCFETKELSADVEKLTKELK